MGQEGIGQTYQMQVSVFIEILFMPVKIPIKKSVKLRTVLFMLIGDTTKDTPKLVRPQVLTLRQIVLHIVFNRIFERSWFFLVAGVSEFGYIGFREVLVLIAD